MVVTSVTIARATALWGRRELPSRESLEKHDRTRFRVAVASLASEHLD